MLPDLTPPTCTECGYPAQMEPHIRHYRRAGHILAVETGIWVCARCADPFTGERPFRFADMPLLAWTDARAAALWQERFGEALPPSARGRRSGPRRTERIPVMLTPEELARLDTLRGDLTRSEYLRRTLRADKAA